MTSFIHTTYPAEHPGLARAESVFTAARQMRSGFDSAKGLSTLLLAAMVSGLVVVADRYVDQWTNGNLMAAWIVLWAIGAVAIALFAGTARRLSGNAVKSLDAWSYRIAQVRADERLWNTAQHDPRVMADLQAAIHRSEGAAPAMAFIAPKQTFSVANALEQWRAEASRARADARLWAVAQRDSRVMSDIMAAQARAEANVQAPVQLPAATRKLIKAENAASLRDALYDLRPKFAYYV